MTERVLLSLPDAAADALAPNPDRMMTLALAAFMQLEQRERWRRCWAAPGSGTRSVWLGPAVAAALNRAATDCGGAYDRVARAALAYATESAPRDAASGPLSA